MRRMIVVLAGLLLMAGSLAAQSQDRLLPQKKRITDEAIARDRALIQTWLARADSLPRNPGDLYARARAIALLEFVGTEYDRANRSPVLDTSFVHAVAIVERIQSGQTWYETVREPAGAEAVAPGLWHQLDSLQGADLNHCAESEIAQGAGEAAARGGGASNRRAGVLGAGREGSGGADRRDQAADRGVCAEAGRHGAGACASAGGAQARCP